MVRFAFAVALAVAAGCQSSTSPQVRVLGVHQQSVASHVFVQVRNPAQRPMRLQKLEYVFASSKGTTIAEGQLPLEREIPAGAVAVLDVPLDVDGQASETLTLRGRLTAELDQIVRTFKVSAEIQPH